MTWVAVHPRLPHTPLSPLLTLISGHTGLFLFLQHSKCTRFRVPELAELYSWNVISPRYTHSSLHSCIVLHSSHRGLLSSRSPALFPYPTLFFFICIHLFICFLPLECKLQQRKLFSSLLPFEHLKLCLAHAGNSINTHWMSVFKKKILCRRMNTEEWRERPLAQESEKDWGFRSWGKSQSQSVETLGSLEQYSSVF